MKFREILRFYRFANKQRDEFYNVKWRLVVICLVIAAMWFVYSYLQAAYPASPERLVLSTESGTSVQASERMFNWFVTGFLTGFLAFTLMFEGEFLIVTAKLTKLLNLNDLEERKGIKRKKKKGK